jgi:hypothetical protein
MFAAIGWRLALKEPEFSVRGRPIRFDKNDLEVLARVRDRQAKGEPFANALSDEIKKAVVQGELRAHTDRTTHVKRLRRLNKHIEVAQLDAALAALCKRLAVPYVATRDDVVAWLMWAAIGSRLAFKEPEFHRRAMGRPSGGRYANDVLVLLRVRHRQAQGDPPAKALSEEVKKAEEQDGPLAVADRTTNVKRLRRLDKNMPRVVTTRMLAEALMNPPRRRRSRR